VSSGRQSGDYEGKVNNMNPIFLGADLDVLPQTTLDGCKVVVNNHAGASSLCMN